MIKKLLTGVMILAIILSPIAPKNVLAQPKEDLTSITFSNWIRTLGSQYPLLQSYGLVILKQPNINIKNMSSLNNHQQIARSNVREWLDYYSPKLIYLNESLNSLSQRTDQYYNRLYQLAGQIDNEQEKKEFLNRFNRLQDTVEDIQISMQNTSTDLNTYKGLLISDNQALAERAEKAIHELSGDNGEAVKLGEQIKKLLAEIQEELLKILNNPEEVSEFSFNFGKQIYDLVKTSGNTKTIDVASLEALGKVLVNAKSFETKQYARSIQQKHEELLVLMKKLSEVEMQITEVTVMEDQIVGFEAMVKREVTILDKVANEFTALNNVMNSLAEDVESGSITPAELQKQLKYLKAIIRDIDEQTKQFEGFTTNIK
ncbi:HBL/NHE enterotoxin family protein [Siminovitchia sp. FSL H7-0308]|uniref:HBL/NHE enterotoxin family protein n=2 Tax=unclassified Siminovitchia TaxID=2837530 RepID=UPI0030EF297D